MAMKRKRLGEMLLEESVVTEAQIEEALSVNSTDVGKTSGIRRCGSVT